MKTFRFLNLAVLALLVGSAAAMYAQEEKKEEPPARQEEARPEARPQEAKPEKQEEAKPSKEQKQQEERRGEERSNGQAMPEHQDMHDHAGQAEHQDMHPAQGQEHAARPAGKGGHIPDDKFHAHFGRSHSFRAQTVIVSGRPQFQYGGYSFELVDAWPADWAYTDDCYIDYIDGEYFLFDLLHPGIRIAVFVVM